MLAPAPKPLMQGDSTLSKVVNALFPQDVPTAAQGMVAGLGFPATGELAGSASQEIIARLMKRWGVPGVMTTGPGKLLQAGAGMKPMALAPEQSMHEFLVPVDEMLKDAMNWPGWVKPGETLHGLLQRAEPTGRTLMLGLLQGGGKTGARLVDSVKADPKLIAEYMKRLTGMMPRP